MDGPRSNNEPAIAAHVHIRQESGAIRNWVAWMAEVDLHAPSGADDGRRERLVAPTPQELVDGLRRIQINYDEPETAPVTMPTFASGQRVNHSPT
jgi:hypothetical protein